MEKLTALLLAGVLAGSAFTGCGKQSNDSSKPESSAAEESSVKETEAAAETTEATTTTVHVSPTETVSSTLGTELTDINAMLDKGSDTANNYKAKLDNFIQEGDVVQSFTFIVYSADGSSSLGDFKGGYGVPSRTAVPAQPMPDGIRRQTLNSPRTAPMRNSPGMFPQRSRPRSTPAAKSCLVTGGAMYSR